MKLFLLAAAATLATPALAQTMPAPAPGASNPDMATPAPPADAAATQPDAMQTAPSTPADTANPPGTTTQPMNNTMPMAQTSSATNAAGDPVGGYQPSMPAMSGPMTPGVTPVFRPAPTPDQAYPAPAPLASYPMCKPGQFDNCMQGRGSTHSRQVRGRRSR